MKNRFLDKKNPKDKFIIETLLPYLVNHIEESDPNSDVINDVSSMFVFPYRTSEGTKLGSLMEPGVSWYFDKNKDKKVVSSGGYRIIDDSVLTEKNAKNFRKTFKEYYNITEFSDQVVIMDLLDKMSLESDYTSQWWTYAYDVFKLWCKEDFNSSLEKATKNISNKRFLFIDNIYSDSLKQRLLEEGIFSDIRETSFKTHFWNFIKKAVDKKKAIDVLSRMGVPHTFVENGEVNKQLLIFFEESFEDMDYPVNSWENGFEKCELSCDIMYEIYKEDSNAFLKIANDSNINAGMVMKNILGSYVPLSWDLFYTTNVEKEKEEDSENLDDDRIKNLNLELESLQIDDKKYDKKLLNNLEQCHEFSEVNESFYDYKIDIGCNVSDFYKWIWMYSKHKELIENILCFYTYEYGEFRQVPDSDTMFVLSVLSSEGVTDNNYQFDLKFDPKDCFDNANIINKISNQFSNIRCMVGGYLEKFNDSDILYKKILPAILETSHNQKISRDLIWDNIYLVEGKPNCYDDVYVRCKNDDDDILLLWPTSNDNSYLKALVKYVSNQYGLYIDCADIDCVDIDWKEEYKKLVKGIYEFISVTNPVIKESELYRNDVDLADVSTFRDERMLWQKLNQQKEKILSQPECNEDIMLDDCRTFLENTYSGRCQLCGKRIVTSEANAHFFTYRINKKSKNKLADLNSNIFCLCPSCFGEMGFGSYMGKNMRKILETAKQYWEYYESKCNNNEMEDDFESLIADVAYESQKQVNLDDSDDLKGFKNPIICDVTVNGKDRKMVFSWEHFIRLSFELKTYFQIKSDDNNDI